ncbi:FkbM family methyltransferase [Thalassobaculum sp.]|uniref:FkbM family methyltransferase n=1 Tax=Thalassobaculum sp. TaxID=2022740 RepID=UPI0032ED8856
MDLSSRAFSAYGDTVATPMLRIDSLGLGRCDFIKVDVEGAEALVFAGALGTIAACRPVLSVECDRPDQMAIVVDALLSRGYRLWRFRGVNMRVPNPKGAQLDGVRPISILMLLAVPEERLDRLDAVDRSALQGVGDRAAFELMSRGIVREEPA